MLRIFIVSRRSEQKSVEIFALFWSDVIVLKGEGTCTKTVMTEVDCHRLSTGTWRNCTEGGGDVHNNCIDRGR
jgi:hypothetical protein